MVQKSARYGVHSGNTLRSSNTRYSRRYFSEACIVSRVHSSLLAKLQTASAKTAADPGRAPQANVAIDVALSLNKQNRWLLPSALKRQITSDDVADPELTVSLLERHKLKRHANCVSFCSTAGAVRTIRPRDCRYFSFAFPSSDGQSKRARRRELRKERLRMLRTSPQDRPQQNEPEVKTEGEVALEATTDLGESEVRYEVFYPCPWRSSLSHNPKYIKQLVSITTGDEGQYLEQGKPRKKHRRRQRKRMTLKDIDNSYEESEEEGGFSLEDFDESDVGDASQHEALHAGVGSPRKTATFELFLVSFIENRETLQQKRHQRMRKGNVSQKKTTCDGADARSKKSHIVYVPAETEART